MPWNGMNFWDRRGGTYQNICTASDPVNSQVPGKALVNGAIVPDSCPAAANSTSRSTPAGILCSTKPPCLVNGYINYRYKGRNTNVATRKTKKKGGNPISPVTDAATTGRVSSPDIPSDVSATCDFYQTPPDQNVPAAGKNQRRKKTFRCKKRMINVACLENWEDEIQEVKITDWDKMCFGVCPYGPEDVLHFSLQDMTLGQTNTGAQPMMADYRPTMHHPHHIQWIHYTRPTEPDQFADAEE